MPSLMTVLMVIGAVMIVAVLVWAFLALSRRPKPPVVIDPDEDLKQTCELNYTPE